MLFSERMIMIMIPQLLPSGTLCSNSESAISVI